MQACSLAGAVDSDDSDMDAEMDKIGEMLLAQTAANASSRSMPLPVDRRKASNNRVKPTPTPTQAAAPKPKSVQKTQVDSELEKLADMLLAQQTAASVDGSRPEGMPLPVDQRKAAKPLDWGAKPLSESPSSSETTAKEENGSTEEELKEEEPSEEVPKKEAPKPAPEQATQVGREFESETEAAAIADAEKMARDALASYDAEAPECVLEESYGEVIRTDLAGGMNTEHDVFPGEIPDFSESPSQKSESPFGPGFQREEDKQIRQMCLVEEPAEDVAQLAVSPDANAFDEVQAFAIDPDFDYDNVELDPYWR